MTSVINQYGRYVVGQDHDRIVAAHEKGETSLEIGGVQVDILWVDRDEDGNVTIKVEIHLL